MKKSILKEGYYWEFDEKLYGSLPDNLPAPAKFKKEIFPRSMKHKEILEEYKIEPYKTFTEAASVIASIIPELKNDYNGFIAYFKHNNVTCRLDVWRDGGGELGACVNGVYPGSGWSAGGGVLFSNSSSETLNSDTESLGNSDTLTLEKRVEKLEEMVENVRKFLME